MNLRLLLQTLRWNQVRLLIVAVASFGWGLLLPVIYVAFADAFRQLVNSGVIPSQLLNFGSGSLASLPGALTLGLQHPMTIAFLGIFAVGSTVGAVAGERERGTLEVLLSRPISRRTLYVTLAVAMAILLAVVLGAILLGQVAGMAMENIIGEVDMAGMPLVFLNGLLLWGAFAAIGLAASVSFDRYGPAIGLTLAVVLVSYFLEILGSLWPDAAFLQPYSLFHHWQPGKILTGKADPFDFALLAVVILVPVVYSLSIFPRRDLAAPS